MKNIVRSLVVVLALTGAIASSYAKAPTSSTATIATSKTSAAPVPRCAPSDPGDCGLSSW